MNTNDEIRRLNLLIAIKEAHTAANLAKIAGVNSYYLSQIKNKTPESKTGKPKAMGDEVARKIEIGLKKPEGWMDVEHPDYCLNEPQISYQSDTPEARRSMQNVMHAPLGTRKIPLISYIQAGELTETIDSYHPGDAASWLFTDQELSASAFALEIKGDSMLPEFKPGDRVIIDPAVRPSPGDFVAAKNGENEATFKKYRPRGMNEHGEQVIELVPLNPDFPSIRSDISPLTIIGTMMEHHKYRPK